MTNARMPVRPPAKELLTYGLFSVAEMRTSTDPHWQAGVTWVNVCPDAATTYDECVLGNALGSELTAASAKAATAVRSIWGATPFTVVTEIDCSAPGYWEDADEFVSKAFGESEQFTVEQVFFTGTVNDIVGLQRPHLVSAAEEVETEPGGATLQLSAVSLAPTGGSALDVVEALGKLELALSACVKGVGVIHISAELLPHLVANHQVEEEGGVFYTRAGHKLAVSAGYNGASPDGVVQVGVSWMYGTGPVFIYRSRGNFIGDKEESFDLAVNTLMRIYERTYVIGYDCCLFAVPVSTGGVVTGSINAAT